MTLTSMPVRQDKVIKNITAVTLALVAVFPLIQLGYSQFISFQFVGILILAAYAWLQKSKGIVIDIITVLVLTLPSVFAFINSELFISDLLRVLREAFNLIVLTITAMAAQKNAQILNINIQKVIWLKNLVQLVIFFILALTIGQLIAIQYGYRLWFPLEFYARPDPILPTELDVQYGKITGLRPTSFFTEPSYLGFISLSLLLIVWAINFGKKKWLLIGLLFITTYLSRSLLGLITFIALLGFLFIFSSKNLISSDKKIPLIFVSLVIFVSILYLIISLQIFPALDRLYQILQGNTNVGSANSRILIPLSIITEGIIQFPLGIPSPEIRRIFSYLSEDVRMDNALLSTISAYGFLSLPLLTYIFLRLRNPILIIYFIFATWFNGSIFYYDKTVILSVSMIIFIFSIKNQRAFIQKR